MLALFAGGIYFYNKKETNSLIIICLLALVVYLLVDNGASEHLTTDQTEALQNLSSMYQNGVLKATNLEVTGNITLSNPNGLSSIIASGNLNVQSGPGDIWV